MNNHKIPVSVVVMTLNNGAILSRCLEALESFSETFVVDSASTDDTVAIAHSLGAHVFPFTWNGRYPKKKQWCLENLPFVHDWVFFVDADEILTPSLINEIDTLFRGVPDKAGYFIAGLDAVGDKVFRFGGSNRKLALLNRHNFAFPVIDDLDVLGGYEVEGHYQPQRKKGCEGVAIGCLKAPLHHYIEQSTEAWDVRHKRYAQWEAAMNRRNAWPEDPVPFRQSLKKLFRTVPMRPLVAFCYSFFFRLGFLNGNAGLKRARDRYRYYKLIRQLGAE